MIDWDGWPLLVIRAAELPADEARGLVADTLAKALERDEPFTAVVELPPHPSRHRVRAAMDQVRTIKRLRPGLVQHCRGLAMVVDESVLRDQAKLIKNGQRFWGCPIAAVTDPAEAHAWARERLAAGRP